MQQLYLPVYGHSRFAGMVKQVFGVTAEGFKIDAKGKTTEEFVGSPWFDGRPLDYSHGLISYVHWRVPYTFPAGSYIFGDSGGFTLVAQREKDRPGRGGFYSNMKRTRGGSLDAAMLMPWQISMCTVGALLDRPPREHWKTRHRVWEQALTETVGYTGRGLPTYEKARRDEKPFRWWGVIHGNTWEEQLEWWQAVSAVYPFTDSGEGWAIRAEPDVNPYTVAQCLRTLSRLKIKRAHFLAATSQAVTAVLFALGPEAGLDLVTYDSAYATKAANNRQVLRVNLMAENDTDKLTWSVYKEEGPARHVRDFLLDECQCRPCVWMRKRSMEHPQGIRETKRDPKVPFGGWMSTWANVHNINAQHIQLERQFELAQKDPDYFLREMLGRAEAFRVRRIFEGHETAGAVKTGSECSLLEYL